MAGLLSGEIGEIVYGPCALHIHDCMEAGVSLHRQ